MTVTASLSRSLFIFLSQNYLLNRHRLIFLFNFFFLLQQQKQTTQNETCSNNECKIFRAWSINTIVLAVIGSKYSLSGLYLFRNIFVLFFFFPKLLHFHYQNCTALFLRLFFDIATIPKSN